MKTYLVKNVRCLFLIFCQISYFYQLFNFFIEEIYIKVSVVIPGIEYREDYESRRVKKTLIIRFATLRLSFMARTNYFKKKDQSSNISGASDPLTRGLCFV